MIDRLVWCAAPCAVCPRSTIIVGVTNEACVGGARASSRDSPRRCMGAPPVPLGPVVTVMSDGTSRGQVDDQASKKEQSTMDVARFEDLQAAFLERIQHAVYCNVATIDHHQRPRSRVMHPIWDGAIGWVISWPQSHKAKHLAQNPAVSLAYLHDPLKPVYVDGTATWIDDATEQRRIWELHKTTPPPLGLIQNPTTAPSSIRILGSCGCCHGALSLVMCMVSHGSGGDRALHRARRNDVGR